MKIISIKAHEVYDSRGWPTVCCIITLQDGRSVMAHVPSGASVGLHEAHELRDGGNRLWGKGVQLACKNIETIIAPELIGREVEPVQMDLQMISLDGTENKSNIGANALLAVSMALYKAQALIENIELYESIAYICGYQQVSLPFAMLNFINGGMHAKNNLQIQEFMVVPVGMSTFRESLECAAYLFHFVQKKLASSGKIVCFGDEGGVAPFFDTDDQALDFLAEQAVAVEQDLGCKFVLALDVAASTFYDQRTKTYVWQGTQVFAQDLIGWYKKIIQQYPIYSIEDGLAEDDWKGWCHMTQELSGSVQLVADDLFATNPSRIGYGVEQACANAVLIKPNQIGTITETLQVIKFCQDNDLTTIVSHRSGETTDSFIADLAVGSNAGQVKCGGLSRGERMAKYNRLLIIEDQLLAGSPPQDFADQTSLV